VPRAKSKKEVGPNAMHAEQLRRRRRVRAGGAAAMLVVIIAIALWSGRDRARPGEAPAPNRREAACGATSPPESKAASYERPADVLKPGVDYRAVIETSCGPIALDLLEDRAPETVNNFVFLARDGYYDGLTWHRVIQDFVIQTGDPDGINGHPPDGPGYTIPDEFAGLEGSDYVFGAVAMANAGQPDTGGSQFFIVVQPEGPAGLDPLYSLFGRVTGSRQTLLEIAAKPTTEGNDPALMDEPLVPIYINSIEIFEH
jgi:cyclophilin family peptidyl-prolyl cis-trans isomerase